MPLPNDQVFMIVNEKKTVTRTKKPYKRVLDKPYVEDFTGLHIHFADSFTSELIKELDIKGNEKILLVHKSMQQQPTETIVSYARDRIKQGKFTSINQMLAA